MIMADGAGVAQRIKAEFDSRAERLQTAQRAQVTESQERDKRIAHFNKVCDGLRPVWKSRFDEFARQFGDKIRVVPVVEPSRREAKVVFLTDLASVTLTLNLLLSSDLQDLICDYELLIIPLFFEYDRYARFETPLDNVDEDAFGKWIEDRLVSCVKAYLSILDNQFYIARAMVEDPVSKVKFLKDDAAATLEQHGRTMYFASNETLNQYKKQKQVPV